MKRSTQAGALLLAIVVLCATSARAQTNFNVAAGVSLAMGDFGDRAEAGYTLIAGIGGSQRGSPISFRAEAMYTEHEQKRFPDKARAVGVSGLAVYDFSPLSGGTITPYAIGGISFASTRQFNLDSRTNVGWNIGGGFRFPLTGFSAYVEARYHSISDVDMSFLPIVFGLRF
jgi:hypothetical protein